MKSLADKTVPAVILFADLVGSSEVGNTLDPKAYWRDYISNFYAAITVALETSEITPGGLNPVHTNTAGDECVIFMEFESRGTNTFDAIVHKLVRFTYILKSLWFISPFNLKRMSGDAAPREISVGAHCGKIIKINRREPDPPWLVGHTINVAKRIESMSRDRRNLNFCVSAPIGAVIQEKIRELSTFSTYNITYGLLGVSEPEYRPMKGIEPTVRVNEMVIGWDIKEKSEKDAFASVRELTKRFVDGDQSLTPNITDGANLMESFRAKVSEFGGKNLPVDKFHQTLVDFASRYAHDSWSRTLAGLSLLSMANMNAVKARCLGKSATEAGKEVLEKILSEHPKV